MTGAELASAKKGLLDARTHQGWSSWAQHPAQASTEAQRALRGLGAPLPSAPRPTRHSRAVSPCECGNSCFLSRGVWS